MTKKKKVLPILLALACVMSLSVNVFAATAYDPASAICSGILRNDGDRFTFIHKIPASTFSEEKLALWKRLMKAFLKESNDCIVINCSLGVTLEGAFEFYLIPAGITYTKDSFYLKANSGNFEYLRIDKTSSGFSVIQGSNSMARVNVSLYYDNRLSARPSGASYIDYKGVPLVIEDDLNEEPNEPEEPVEPDTSSSSSTGGWTPPIVSDPEIPEGDEYVFYDTAILKDFLKYVRDAMGKSINVGWLIFGFILMWLIIKKVIKSFSSR